MCSAIFPSDEEQSENMLKKPGLAMDFYCVSCRTKAKPGAKFCTKCGGATAQYVLRCCALVAPDIRSTEAAVTLLPVLPARPCRRGAWLGCCRVFELICFLPLQRVRGSCAGLARTRSGSLAKVRARGWCGGRN